ncbi:MAG: T9SS type A sorting domain-containing protein [Bacteroidales bacterium]
MNRTLPSSLNIKMKSKIIFFFLFIQCSFMSAQTLSINTAEVCAGQEVLLPVTSTSLSNVGALTLFIAFDTLNLTFDSIENIDPQLAGMSTNMMTAPAQLAFAWSSTTPVSFINGKLFDLKFITNGQSSPVYYNPGCEIADPAGVVIPVIYSNGAVNSGLPVIFSQPKDTLITEGGQSTFSVSSPNAASYFWKESQDHGISWLTLEDGGIYSGTHTETLSISPVPLTYNQNQYQCVLTHEPCVSISDPAILSVDAQTSTGDFSNHGEKEISITPVPFNDHLNIGVPISESGNTLIQVMNCVGQLVSESNFTSLMNGTHLINLNTSSWQPGIYFVKLSQQTSDRPFTRIVRVIKTN